MRALACEVRALACLLWKWVVIKISLKMEYCPKLPKESGTYLVILSEQSLFDGKLSKPRYDLLEWSTADKCWNTKAAVKIYAWARLPSLSGLP